MATGAGVHGATSLNGNRGEGGTRVDDPDFLHLVDFLVVGDGRGDIAGGGGRESVLRFFRKFKSYNKRDKVS